MDTGNFDVDDRGPSPLGLSVFSIPLFSGDGVRELFPRDKTESGDREFLLMGCFGRLEWLLSAPELVLC